MPDNIPPLYEPDTTRPEGELEFPPIPRMSFRDPYSGVTIEFKVPDGDVPRLVLTHGDLTTDDVFASYGIDLPDDFLFSLADRLITPLREYRAMEQADTAARIERERKEREAKEDTYAFRAAVVGLLHSRDYKLIVHRRRCRHAMDANPASARQGTGTFAPEVYRADMPLVAPDILDPMVKQARERLKLLADEQHVQANAARVAAGMNQRVRDTALNQKPLQFCGTCKPLGRNTSALMTRAFDLANLTVFKDTAVQDIHDLFGEIETALRETEQEHLDTLRAKGNE